MTERPTAARPTTDRRPTPEEDPRTRDPRTADPRTAESEPGATRQQPTAEQADALLGASELDAVTRRWHEIQGAFVDAPQQAVHDADALVAELLNRLMRMFADERSQLETQWSRGDQVTTEELRVALQKYRAFFQRLLTVH